MTIKWNLPKAMFDKGVFTPTELRKLLRTKVGYDLSAPAVYRLVNQKPKEFKLETMDALCQALECSLDDIVLYEPPTKANRCIQPLVMESSFKPPKQRIKKSKEKINIDLPEI